MAKRTTSGDHILRGLLRDQSVRVVAAVTSNVGREAARRHQALGAPAAALSRGSTAGLLLATLTKDRERMTAQLTGDGPLGTVVIDADADGNVRSYVKNPGVPLGAQPGTRVSLTRGLGPTGIVRVTRDLGLREVVNGQTPMVDGEIDSDLESYLIKSEQVDSALACEALLGDDLDIANAGGVLLQTLPGSGEAAFLEAARLILREGALTRALASARKPLTAEALLREALGADADDLQVLDVRPVRFHCSCSKERAAATLALLGSQDLRELAREEDGATVACEFCRAEHVFTRDELEDIAAGMQTMPQ